MPFIISNTQGIFKYASQNNFDKYNTAIALSSLAIPVPDLLWFKFDSTTYSGTGSTLINAATSGSSNNGSFWSANGTLVNTTVGGAPCLRAVSSNNYFVMTTPALSLPSNAVVGNGYTIAFWVYIPVGSWGNAARIFSLGNSGNTAASTDAGSDAPSIYTGTNIPGTVAIQYAGSSYYPDTTSFTGNVWTHVAFTSTVKTAGSSAAGAATSAYYINGTAKSGFNPNSNCNAYLATGTSYNVGMADHSITEYFYDLRVYGTPLSASAIQNIYQYGSYLGYK